MNNTISLIAILGLFLASFSSIAQTGTNLEFSRIVSLQTDGETGLSPTEVVPSGKIWKLTGYACDLLGGSYVTSCWIRIIIDNYEVTLFKNDSYNTNSESDIQNTEAALPLYFNEGNNLQLKCTTSGTYELGSYASFIEYTVIP